MGGPYDIYPREESTNYSDTLGIGNGWGTWFPAVLDFGGGFAFNRLTDVASGMGGSPSKWRMFTGHGSDSEYLRAVNRGFGSDVKLMGMGYAKKTWANITTANNPFLGPNARGPKFGQGAATMSRFAGAAYAAKAVGTSIFAWQMASMAAGVGSSLVGAAADWRPRAPSRGKMTDFGSTYFDSAGAYTMRQRSLNAIYNSQLTTRAAIGNESSFLHY